jgi:hypothetical protein
MEKIKKYIIGEAEVLLSIIKLSSEMGLQSHLDYKTYLN